MDPIIGLVAGYPVYMFAVFLNLGVVAGLTMATWLGAQRDLPVAALLDAALWVLSAAFVGARLQYVVAHWSEYSPHLWTVFNVWEGGLALPGAVTAGAVAAWPVLRLHHLSLGHALDASAAGLAFAQAVGRLGCLRAGCATGMPVVPGSGLPWLLLPDATGAVAARFPSQIVEAVAELVLGLLLVYLWQHRLAPGTVAATYLLGYGLLRAAVEPLRGDATLFGPLPAALWWALASVTIGAALLLYGRRPLRRRPPRARRWQHAGDMQAAGDV